jgi:hypothetical protein
VAVVEHQDPERGVHGCRAGRWAHAGGLEVLYRS